jgi:ElaB/YqjD/DUF883 family membrane-anchored ribosome-binding protein
MYATELKDASRERLIHDLKNVVSDIELFLSASAGEAGEAYDVALGKLKTVLDAATSEVVDAQRGIVERARTATRATDTYIHENAWTMIAAAAVTGLLAGLLVMRR